MLNLAALEQASVHVNPLPFVAVPNFIDGNALEPIEKDDPAVSQPGSFPLETLRFAPAFARFMRELRQPAFRGIMANKLGIGLRRRPATITLQALFGGPFSNRIRSRMRSRQVASSPSRACWEKDRMRGDPLVRYAVRR